MNVEYFTPLRFDSSALPVDEQFPTFAAAIGNFRLSRQREGPFRVKARVWRVGALILTEVTADPATYHRDIAQIGADGVDHIYVNLHCEGGVRFDGGRGPRQGGPGSMLVIDMAQPCRMDAEDRRSISLAVPRYMLLPFIESFDPHGLIAQDGLVPLFAETMQAVCAALPRTAMLHAGAIERMIVQSAGEMLRDALRTAASVSPREDALRARVHAFLDAHLAEPLDVTAICRAVGVSRSSLYRVCGGGGGIARLLRQRRLRRLRALLEDPGEDRNITDLAALVGFRDKSHLSRSFKQHYGLSPHAYRTGRAAGQHDEPATGNAAVRLFRSWVRDVQ